MNDLYEILGINPDATPKDIKRAYRRLSKEHHPDKGGDAEKFQEISLSYAVLSDEERRAKYDQTGRIDETVDIFRRIEGITAQLFMAALEKCGPDEDLVADIRRSIKSKRMEHERKLTQIAEAIGKLEIYRSRMDFNSEEGRHNVFEDVINSRGRDYESQKEAIKGDIEEAGLVLEYLELFTYESVKGRPKPTWANFNESLIRRMMEEGPGDSPFSNIGGIKFTT